MSYKRQAFSVKPGWKDHLTTSLTVYSLGMSSQANNNEYGNCCTPSCNSKFSDGEKKLNWEHSFKLWSWVRASFWSWCGVSYMFDLSDEPLRTPQMSRWEGQGSCSVPGKCSDYSKGFIWSTIYTPGPTKHTKHDHQPSMHIFLPALGFSSDTVLSDRKTRAIASESRFWRFCGTVKSGQSPCPLILWLV